MLPMSTIKEVLPMSGAKGPCRLHRLAGSIVIWLQLHGEPAGCEHGRHSYLKLIATKARGSVFSIVAWATHVTDTASWTFLWLHSNLVHAGLDRPACCSNMAGAYSGVFPMQAERCAAAGYSQCSTLTRLQHSTVMCLQVNCCSCCCSADPAGACDTDRRSSHSPGLFMD
jgi:hypothetical protein